MKTVNNITILLMLRVALLGATALILLIVGVSTKKWATISSSSLSLETKLSQSLQNASFIFSLIIETGASQNQVIAIISQTAAKVEEELSSAFGTTRYYLFNKTPNPHTSSLNLKLPQGLVLAGLLSIFVGTLLAVIIGMLNLWRVVRIIPLMFLIVGPILITVGYIVYTKLLIEDYGNAIETSISIGYSFILVIIGSIIGYITAIFFAFTILYRPNRPPRTFNGGVGNSVVLNGGKLVPVTRRL